MTPEQVAEARSLVIATQFGSVNLLQRRLHIGLARAWQIMDALEREGVVGPIRPGSGTRDVLVSPEPDGFEPGGDR